MTGVSSSSASGLRSAGLMLRATKMVWRNSTFSLNCQIAFEFFNHPGQGQVSVVYVKPALVFFRSQANFLRPQFDTLRLMPPCSSTKAFNLSMMSLARLSSIQDEARKSFRTRDSSLRLIPCLLLYAESKLVHLARPVWSSARICGCPRKAPNGLFWRTESLTPGSPGGSSKTRISGSCSDARRLWEPIKVVAPYKSEVYAGPRFTPGA